MTLVIVCSVIAVAVLILIALVVFTQKTEVTRERDWRVRWIGIDIPPSSVFWCD